MQALKKTFVSILIILIVPLLGVIGGFWVGFRMEHPPVVTSWEALNNPVKLWKLLT
jgi:hypothetical protein